PRTRLPFHSPRRADSETLGWHPDYRREIWRETSRHTGPARAFGFFGATQSRRPCSFSRSLALDRQTARAWRIHRRISRHRTRRAFRISGAGLHPFHRAESPLCRSHRTTVAEGERRRRLRALFAGGFD